MKDLYVNQFFAVEFNGGAQDDFARETSAVALSSLL